MLFKDCQQLREPGLGSVEYLGFPQGRLSLPLPHFSVRWRPHLPLTLCFLKILLKYHFLPPLIYFPFPHPVNTQGLSGNSGLGQGSTWEAGAGQGLETPSLWLSSNLYFLAGAASHWFFCVTDGFGSHFFSDPGTKVERVWCFPLSLRQNQPHTQQLVHPGFSHSVTDGGGWGLSDPQAVQSTFPVSGTGEIMKRNGQVTLFISLNGVKKILLKLQSWLFLKPWLFKKAIEWKLTSSSVDEPVCFEI